ncbi:hypothetical protein GQ53DRAFT_828919 [Thozetella sp. PMI_491]|nr:hypothetical protein GQ53DRAFT_828919 [Thozetella sp. PMI_491]
MDEKRRRPHNQSDGDTEDDWPPTRRQRVDHSRDLGPKHLACPFWKLDPIKHCECFLHKLNTIGYVKQHLARRHTPTFYCQRCYAVFETDKALDRHVINDSCTREDSAELEFASRFVSAKNSRELSRKSKRGLVEEQWFAIWSLLFGERPRPISIYVDMNLSEDFALFREFVQRDGLDALREELEAAGFISKPNISEGELQSNLRRAIDATLEQYLQSRFSIATASRGTLEVSAGILNSVLQLSQPEIIADSLSGNSTIVMPHASSRSPIIGEFVGSIPGNESGIPQFASQGLLRPLRIRQTRSTPGLSTSDHANLEILNPTVGVASDTGISIDTLPNHGDRYTPEPQLWLSRYPRNQNNVTPPIPSYTQSLPSSQSDPSMESLEFFMTTAEGGQFDIFERIVTTDILDGAGNNDV